MTIANFEIKKTSGDTTTDEVYLEPHHTHFIFVDNGTVNKNDTAIEFRARFEARLGKIPLEALNRQSSVFDFEGFMLFSLSNIILTTKCYS